MELIRLLSIFWFNFCWGSSITLRSTKSW